MEVPILSNLESKSEGVKKATEGAEGQVKKFGQVFELIMSKDLVTDENGLSLAMAEDLEAELPAGAFASEETDPDHNGRDDQELDNEQQFIIVLPSIFAPGFLAAPKTTAVELGDETAEQKAQTLDQTLGETLDQTLGETLNQTLGETLNQTLGETLDQALGETLDQTLGEELSQALGEALGQTLGEATNETTAQTPNEAAAQTPDVAEAQKDNGEEDKKADPANIAAAPQLLAAEDAAKVKQLETPEDAADAIASDAEGSKDKTERLWGHWLRARGSEVKTSDQTSGKTSDKMLGKTSEKTSANQQQNGFKQIMTDLARNAEADKTIHSNGEASKADKNLSDLKTLDLKEADPSQAQHQELNKTQATQQPKEAAGLKPARQPSPSAQVSNAVKILIDKGQERMTVRLEPESLGKVEIVLSRDHAGVTASFKVETPQAQQAIAADAAALKHALAAKGVPVVQVVVDMNDGRDSRQSAAQGSKHGKKRRGLNAVNAGEEGDDFSAPRQTAWRPWGFDALI